MTVISYPIPAYSNLPIDAQFYQPSRFVITAISLGSTTTITTSVNHNYVIGQKVRIIIPNTFGTRQLNERSGNVVSIPAANQVVVSIDSSTFDPFVSSTQTTQPQILAIGSIANGAQNTSGISNTGTYIPGSFINISPL